MPGRVDAAREGRFAGQTDVIDLVPSVGFGFCRTEPISRPASVWIIGWIGEVGWCVQATDLNARLGDESWTPLRPPFKGRI